MAGLNFANEREADFFKEAVNRKLRDRELRRQGTTTYYNVKCFFKKLYM